MGAPEAYVEKYLDKECRKHGLWCAKFISPGKNGMPDRLILAPGGHAVFVETKRRDGKTRKLQDIRIRDIRATGADALVCDTRESVDALLETILSKTGDDS